MTRLALEDNPAFEVSDLELRREHQPSFTIDTLRHYHGRLGAGDQLYFIMGMDSFLEFHTWKDYALFLDYGHLIVATRAGYDASTMDTVVPRSILERRASAAGPASSAGACQVWPIEIPPLQISATDLRARQRRGASIRYLVPDAVWRYIQEHQLYRRQA
jgi:nicotinate-nucleotide adenylyltransferase